MYVNCIYAAMSQTPKQLSDLRVKTETNVRSYAVTVRSFTVTVRSFTVTVRSYTVTVRSYTVTVRSYTVIVGFIGTRTAKCSLLNNSAAYCSPLLVLAITRMHDI